MATNEFEKRVLGAPDKNLNPATGLQGKVKTSIFPTSDFESFLSTPTAGNQMLGGGNEINLDPNKFPFQLKAGADNVELRAQDQPVGQELLFGAGRLVSTTATKFLEGFGYAAGAAKALFTDATIGEAIDNGWTNFFGNLEEGLKEAMPIYHTNKYNEGNILQQMGTLGFWMDDMIDGVSFLASAYLGSAAINAALKGTRAFTTLGKTFARATKAVKAGKASMIPNALKLSKVVKEMDLLTMSAFNSVVEAGFEAKDLQEQMRASGYTEEEAAAGAAGVFKWNMGALMLSNYVTNSLFFGDASPMKGRIKNIIDPKTNRLISEVAPLTKAQKFGAFAAAGTKSMVSEGLYEENIQQSIQDFFGGKTKGQGEVEGILGGMFTNLKTNEGQKAIVMGALIGLIPGGVGGLRQLKAENLNEKSLHVILGHTINAVNDQLDKQDIWAYEGEGENRKVMIDPETKEPLKDPIKIAQYFANVLSTNLNLTLSLIASENGNKIMEDRLEEERWSSLALGHMFHPEGEERFKVEVDNFAADRIEKAKKENIPIDEKKVKAQAEKIKQKAKYYKLFYDNIAGNYAGLYDFETAEDNKEIAMQARIMKDTAVQAQFMGAVDQLFWRDTINKLEEEKSQYTDPAIADQQIAKDKVKQIEAQIEQVKETLADSEAQYKNVMDESKWQARFDASKKQILEYQSRDTTEVKDEKATPKDEQGERLKVQDSEGAEYEYKGTNNAGNHVFNDGKNDIILTPTQVTKKGIKLTEEGTPLLDHIQALKETLPVVEETVSSEEIKKVSDVIEEKRAELDVATEEERRRARKKAVVDELSTPKHTEITGAESEEDIIQKSITETLIEKYANRTLMNGNLETAFGVIAEKEEFNVVYNNEYGVLFIDKEENEVIFKADETGKETIIGKTTDDMMFRGAMSMFDLGIIPLQHTIFDIEVMSEGTGNGIVVQGRRYTIATDPMSSIEHNEKGLPTSVTLYDSNGTPVKFTNPALVEELSYTMALIDEARIVVEEEYLKDRDTDFIVVTDPRPDHGNIKYYVYPQSDGTYKVVKPHVTNVGVEDRSTVAIGFTNIVNEKFKQLILDAYFDDISRIANRIAAERVALGARSTDAEITALKKKVKDEITQFVEISKNIKFKTREQNEIEKLARNSRPATEAEALAAPSPTKVSTTEGTANAKAAAKKAKSLAKPAGKVRPPRKETVKETADEKEIVEEKAEEIVEAEENAPVPVKPSSEKDKLGVEPLNHEESRDLPALDSRDDEDENSRGILASATAVAWLAEENPEADVFFSNPENDLTGMRFEASIDYENTASGLTPEQLTEAYITKKIDKIFKDKFENDNFDSVVDRVPIKLTLFDAKGKEMPIKGLFIHDSSFDNIAVPYSIRKLKDISPREYSKAKEDYIDTKKQETRAFRHAVLLDLLTGKRVTLSNLSRGKGSLNYNPGVNHKITDITDSPDNGELAVTDSYGAIRTSDRIASGTGGVGNVFWLTTETITEEEFPIKLNVSKVSPEAAKILLNAYVMAAKGLGTSTLYQSKDVDGGLTAGEVINLLVLEGPITDQENKDRNPTPSLHLIEKTLFYNAKTGNLHYGRQKLNLRRSVTAEQEKAFIDHITTHKNYVVPLAENSAMGVGLGKKLTKDFRIGKIVGKEGDTYQAFLIRNGMVLTDALLDLVTGRLFSKPAIIFESGKWATKEEVKEQEAPVEEEIEEEDQVVEEEVVPKEPVATETIEIATAMTISLLPAGAEIFSRIGMGDANLGTYQTTTHQDTSYGKIVEKDGKKIFKTTATDADIAKSLKEYDGMETSNPAIVGIVNKVAKSLGESKLMRAEYAAPVYTKGAPSTLADLSKALEEEILREATPGPYTIGDIHKATKWLRNKFGPSLTIQQEEKLIEVMTRTGNKEAFGTFAASMIKLSKRMEIGTEYHEAFHDVSLAYLSPVQRKAIHDEARVKYGQKDATEREINEILAEKYRSFELAGGKSKERGKIKTLFKDIWDFIRTLFTGKLFISDLDINNLFRVMHKSNGRFGRLYQAQRNLQSVKLLGDRVYNKVVKGTDLMYITSDEVLNTVVKNLVYVTLVRSGTFTTKDISNLNYTVAREVMQEKADIARASADAMLAGGKKADHDVAIHTSNFYQEIVDNYGVFVELMRDNLETLGVRTKLPEDPEDENDFQGFNFTRYDKASFELDGKDNAATAIKFIVATLPSSEEKDKATSMIQFVDFDEMWDALQMELYKYDNVDDMIKVLKTKLPTPYKYLVKRLERDKTNDQFDTLRTQFYIAMRKNRYSYDHGLVERKEGKFTLTISNAETQRAGDSQAVLWGQEFLMSNMFKDGAPVKEKIEGIVNDFERIYLQVRAEYKNTPLNMPGYEEMVSSILDLFSKISVNINRQALDIMLSNLDDTNQSQALYDLVVDTRKSKMSGVFGKKGTFARLTSTGKVTDPKGREQLIQNIFKNEKFFAVDVASAYLEVVGGVTQSTILGPDGNAYHLVSENSYLTDVIRDLTNLSDPTLFNQMTRVGYAQSSYLLEQMINPEVRQAVSVGVFSAFSMTKTNDKGRAFEDLSPVENILLQMALFKAGRIPLPQLGDRRHLYTIKGLKPIEFKYVYDPRTGELGIPKEVLRIFTQYALDEYERIERTRAEITDALAKNKEYILRENYHFKYKKGTNERDYTQGNGLFYQHFTDFNGQGVKKEDISNLVRKTINERINDGIKEFAERGIITLTKNGKVGANKMLSKTAIKQLADTSFGGRENIAIDNEIANYTLNSIMATIEAEKLIFMDPAYYANLEDKIKRYTAIASTGSTGRLNIAREILKGDRLLHDKDQFHSAILKTQYYDAKVIREELEKKFAVELELQGYTKTAAETKAKLKAKKFSEVDPTDGQAYITPEMFRAIHIRLGEWTQDKQDAYDLLNVIDLTEEQQKVFDNLFMQPLKYGYFGPKMGIGTMSPVYFKMSLATLTPQLVRGTKLQDMYDRMVDVSDPIDMMLFDSAVKTGIELKYNYYSENEQGEPMTDVVDTGQLAEMVSDKQSFKYLRKQVVTDPHGEVRTFVGTQFRKLILSNIVDSRVYQVNGKPITGEKFKEEYANLVGELSDRGKSRLLKDLGVDEKTLRTTNKTLLKRILREKARAASMSDALIDALSDQIDGIDFEFDALPDRKWIQSTLLALMSKSTVDLQLPGTSLIQMTNFGLRSAKKDNSLQLIDKDGFMEAKVSVEIFRDVIPHYTDLTHEQRLEFANTMLVGVGYRIPTQGLNSIVPLRIVGFLPSTSTATITLPSEFTALTGSDFDIDKLYFIRHNYDIVDGKAVKVEYNEGGTNSTQAVENRLVDMYFGVLLSNDHVLQNWIPLDASTDVIKGIAIDVQALEEKNKTIPSLYSASFMYQSAVKDKYLWGKKGIGPFARANVHHILGQIGGIRLDRYIGVGNTIEVKGVTYTDLSQVVGQDDELIQDWLSALISANVDIAKDPYIFHLNVNAATYGVTELLIRSGVGSDAFWFLTQPALKDYARVYMDSRGRVKASRTNPMKALKKEYNKRMITAPGYVKGMESKADIWNKKRLRNDIDTNTPRNAEFYARQLQIIAEFENLQSVGQSLFEAVNATQIDTKRYGKNLAEVRAFHRLVDKVLGKDFPIVNMDKVFERTFLGKLYQNSVVLAQTLFKGTDILSSEGAIALHNRILSEINLEYNTSKEVADYIGKISDEIYASITGKFMANNMSMSVEELTNMMFGADNMANRLNTLKNNPKYTKNALIKLLAPNLSFDETEPDFIITFSATDSKTKWSKDRITEGWAALLTDNDPVITEFAKDLVKYAFYTSGFKRTIYSIFNFIPPAYLKEIGFSDYIGNMREAFNSDDYATATSSLHDDVIRHLWLDDDVVPYVYEKAAVQRRAPKSTWSQKYPMMVQIAPEGASELFLGQNKDYQFIFKPFIKMVINGHTGLYRYVGFVTTKEGLIAPVYTIDSPRGYYVAGKVIKEYGLDKSVIEANNTVMMTQAELDHVETSRNVQGEAADGSITYDYTTFVQVQSENKDIYFTKKEMEENLGINLGELLGVAPVGEDIVPAEDVTKEEEVSPKLKSLVKDHKMSYDMPAGQNLTRKATTTVELAESGLRTATTRSYKLGEVGKYITFEGRPQQYIITAVEQVTDDKAKNPAWVKAWSEKEQWTIGHFNTIYGGKTVHDGSWQTSFEKIEAEEYPFLPSDEATKFSTASPEMQAAVAVAGITDWTVDKVDPKVMEELRKKYEHCK